MGKSKNSDNSNYMQWLLMGVSVLAAFFLGSIYTSSNLEGEYGAKIDSLVEGQNELKSQNAQHLYDLSVMKLTMVQNHPDTINPKDLAAVTKLKNIPKRSISVLAIESHRVQLDKNNNIEYMPASLKTIAKRYDLTDEDVKVYRAVTRYVPVDEYLVNKKPKQE